MGIIDDLQLGLKNGIVGTHARKVKRQTQKVKATVRGPQIGHGSIPCGIGVEPLQLVGLDSLQFLVEIGKRAPIFCRQRGEHGEDNHHDEQCGPAFAPSLEGKKKRQKTTARAVNRSLLPRRSNFSLNQYRYRSNNISSPRCLGWRQRTK